MLQESLTKIELNNNKEESIKENINFKAIVQVHPNFAFFVQEIQFSDFIRQFTLKTKKKEQKLDDLNSLVFRLAKAVTNPNAINLITENFLHLKTE